MATDFALDAEGNLTLDENGDIKLVTDGEEVAQAVMIALRAWKGEYFLDQSFGVDYLGIIFNKAATDAQREREIRRVIMEVDGVQSIAVKPPMTLSVDQTTRTLSVEFTINTIYGQQQVSL